MHGTFHVKCELHQRDCNLMHIFVTDSVDLSLLIFLKCYISQTFDQEFITSQSLYRSTNFLKTSNKLATLNNEVVHLRMTKVGYLNEVDIHQLCARRTRTMHIQLKEVPCQSTRHDNYGRAFLHAHRLSRFSLSEHVYKCHSKSFTHKQCYLSTATQIKQVAPTHAGCNQTIKKQRSQRRRTLLKKVPVIVELNAIVS